VETGLKQTVCSRRVARLDEELCATLYNILKFKQQMDSVTPLGQQNRSHIDEKQKNIILEPYTGFEIRRNSKVLFIDI